MTAGGRTSIVPYAVLAGLCVALGIVGMMLSAKADRALESIEGSKKQYRQMIQISHEAVEAPDSTGPKTVERTEKWKEMGGYLPTAQRESGILPANMPQIREIPEGTLFKGDGRWAEHGVTITLSTTPEQPLQMSNVAIFLDRIEREQPFLKTTMFTVNVVRGNEAQGEVQMRYWIRKPPE